MDTKKSPIWIEYLILLIIVSWTTFIIIYGSFQTLESLELISIFLGGLFSGIVGFRVTKQGQMLNLLRFLIGVFEFGIAIVLFIMAYNLLFVCIFLLLGCELLGISLALYFGKGTAGSMAGSTREPEVFSPEPSPEPEPL